MNRIRRSDPVSKAITMLLLTVGTVVMILPFCWMILTAFKSPAETNSVNPFVIFPSKLRFDAFIAIVERMDMGRLYFNTLVMIAGRVVCAVLTAATAGYALGRLKFRGRSLCFSLVLFQMMIPAQIFIIPQYLMVSKLGALNTLFALVFPGLVTAFGTFLLRQHFMGLPASLEEAAIIDGCNSGKIFLFIMLPLVPSGLIALGIFTALFAYKDLMWPLVVNTAQNAMPLSSALAKINSQFNQTGATRYPELMAASLLACIPMVIIYLLFQRQFVDGFVTSGVKL
jgi:multiple sugar transport system permease protein